MKKLTEEEEMQVEGMLVHPAILNDLNIFFRFVRYSATAILIFGCTTVTFIVGLWLNIHPLIINTFNFVFWGVIKFVVSDRWVFKKNGRNE